MEYKIIGYSGHAYVCIDAILASGNKVIGYYDIVENLKNPFNLVYLGSEQGADKKDLLFISIGDNKLRERIYLNLRLHFNNIINTDNIIHPFAIISSNVSLKYGNFVAAGAVINSFAKIGQFSIINTSCIIEHECEVGDFVHIAPGAVLAGNVKVGNGAFVGANSVIKQGVTIGQRVIIGAGSVIVKDIPDDAVVYGNPGKIKN